MLTVDTVNGLRQQLERWRASGQRIACVPTMGNLHEGHLALVKRARQLADRVVVTIFVNPLQFGPNEDFAHYPRTLSEDRTKLDAVGADLLFAPSLDEVYPRGQDQVTRIEVPGVSEGLCGASRPGHFSGVATVVAKLFNMVYPHVALFGEKDYQQLLVIRRMVNDLCFPVEIVGMATVREADGLAMSSRNGYLDGNERAIAPQLYAVLREVAALLARGRRDFSGLEALGMAGLEKAGLQPDYFAIRNPETLAAPDAMDPEVVLLAAASVGRTRLIDNIRQSLIK